MQMQNKVRKYFYTGLDPSHTDKFFPLEDTDGRLDLTDVGLDSLRNTVELN